MAGERERALEAARQGDEGAPAMFKAVLETVGMSQSDLARRLGVNARTVRRWCDSRCGNPPEDAWGVLEAAKSAQDEVVAEALGKALDIERGAGARPGSVCVTYWTTSESYAASHGDHGGSWTMANANSRLVAAALERRGLHVVFVEPATF